MKLIDGVSKNLCFLLFQVFTVSKELVPRVLSKIIEAVAEEMSRLMQCVSSFSKNGALQVQVAPPSYTLIRRVFGLKVLKATSSFFDHHSYFSL